MEFREIKIPAELYEKIERRVKNTEFKSVDEYVTYVLREVLASLEEEYLLRRKKKKSKRD